MRTSTSSYKYLYSSTSTQINTQINTQTSATLTYTYMHMHTSTFPHIFVLSPLRFSSQFLHFYDYFPTPPSHPVQRASDVIKAWVDLRMRGLVFCQAISTVNDLWHYLSTTPVWIFYFFSWYFLVASFPRRMLIHYNNHLERGKGGSCGSLLSGLLYVHLWLNG